MLPSNPIKPSVITSTSTVNPSGSTLFRELGSYAVALITSLRPILLDPRHGAHQCRQRLGDGLTAIIDGEWRAAASLYFVKIKFAIERSVIMHQHGAEHLPARRRIFHSQVSCSSDDHEACPVQRGVTESHDAWNQEDARPTHHSSTIDVYRIG